MMKMPIKNDMWNPWEMREGHITLYGVEGHSLLVMLERADICHRGGKMGLNAVFRIKIGYCAPTLPGYYLQLVLSKKFDQRVLTRWRILIVKRIHRLARRLHNF